MDQNNSSVSDVDMQSDELGLLALESTLLRYMVGLSDEARVNMQAWLDSHVLEDNFIIKLLEEYPDIANILAEEINWARDNSSDDAQ